MTYPVVVLLPPAAGLNAMRDLPIAGGGEESERKKARVTSLIKLVAGEREGGVATSLFSKRDFVDQGARQDGADKRCIAQKKRGSSAKKVRGEAAAQRRERKGRGCAALVFARGPS